MTHQLTRARGKGRGSHSTSVHSAPSVNGGELIMEPGIISSPCDDLLMTRMDGGVFDKTIGGSGNNHLSSRICLLGNSSINKRTFWVISQDRIR